MEFNELNDLEREFIKERYRETDLDEALTKDEVQEELSEKFDVSKRTIRTWVKNLGLIKERGNRILIYDIETSQIEFKGWWTGNQYVNHKMIKKNPKIISIAWKWLGENKVQCLHWDENQDDKKMLERFLIDYNSADLIIGQNNDYLNCYYDKIFLTPIEKNYFFRGDDQRLVVSTKYGKFGINICYDLVFNSLAEKS